MRSKWIYLFFSRGLIRLWWIVACVGLFGQRVDASYTRIDTGLHARNPALLQTAETTQDEEAADAPNQVRDASTWLVESITPLGLSDDGEPLAIISLPIPTAHLADHTPGSTRAGPYAAPRTHTRVFYKAKRGRSR